MNALAAIAAATALGVPLADCVARLETVEIAERWRMQPLGSDRVRIINDAYNASPDSMSAALRTLAQITGPGERTVAVLGAMSELGEYAEEEHDRVGLLAVRLGIQRIVVVGAGARRMFLEAIAQGSWDGEAVFFADRRRGVRLPAWASCATATACSSSPRTRRVCGSWAIVWENRSREITPDGGGDLAGIHPLPDARLPAALPQVGLGPGHPHARGRPQPEPRREARHAHDGRHDLHRRHDRRLPRRRVHRQQPADHLGLARAAG